MAYGIKIGWRVPFPVESTSFRYKDKTQEDRWALAS